MHDAVAMTNALVNWLTRGALITWTMLAAAACSDDTQEPATAEATGTGGAGSSASVGTGSGAAGSGGGGGGTAGPGGSGTGGGGTAGPGGSGTGDGGGSDGGAGAGGSGAVSDHGLMCHKSSFPVFSKACEKASDCVVIQHVTSCCGDILFVGVDADDKDTFEDAEKECMASYPPCGCAAGPPRAEDGQQFTNMSGEAVLPHCKEGLCMSEVMYAP